MAHTTAAGASGTGTGQTTHGATDPARRQVLDIFPLTPGQQGILVESLGSAGDPVYLQHYVLDLDGVAEAVTLRAALQLLADELDVLRTGFVWDAGPEPLQVVLAQARVPLLVDDGPAGPGTLGERIAEILREERQLPFDLVRPPLLRVRAVRRGERAWRLVSTHHHLILDAWSVPLLHARLVEILTSLEAGRPVTARPVTGTFHDLVRRQRSTGPEADAAYLRDLLAGVTAATRLGGDLPRRPVPADAGAEAPSSSVTVLHRVDPADHPLRIARRGGPRPGPLVHAAWALLLARWSGTADVVFGTTVSGRSADLPGVTERIGMFVNTAVMRVPVPDGTLGDWLDDVQRRLELVLEHEQAGLSLAQRCAGQLGPGEPLLSSVLALQIHTHSGGDGDTGGNGGPVTLRIVDHAERTGLPLTLSVTFEDDGVSVRVRHDPVRVGAGEAHWIAATAARLVAELAVRARNTRLSDISVIGDLPGVLEEARPRPAAGADGAAFGVRLTVDRLGLRAGERVLVALGPDDPLTGTVELACAAAGCRLERRDPRDVLDGPGPGPSASGAGADVIVAPGPVLPGLIPESAYGARIVVTGDPPSPALVKLVLAAGHSAWRLWASGRTGGADACARIAHPGDVLTLGDLPGGDVVDAQGVRVPPGRSGELQILLPEGARRTGITVRRCDLRPADAELGAEPGAELGAEPGPRLRSGFEQLGRGQDEMLAVEAVLADDTVDVVVEVGPDGPGPAWLAPAATITAGGTVEVDVSAVRARAQTLPARYRPAGYTSGPVLPVAADGSLNRAALTAALAPAPPTVRSRPRAPVGDRLARVPAATRERFLERVHRLAARDRAAVDLETSLSSWKSTLADVRPGSWPPPPAVAEAAEVCAAGTVEAPPAGDDVEARWVAALATAVALLDDREDVLIGVLTDPDTGTDTETGTDPDTGTVTGTDAGRVRPGAGRPVDDSGPSGPMLPVRVRVVSGQSFATTRAAAAAALRAARTRGPVPAGKLADVVSAPLPAWLRIGRESNATETISVDAGAVGLRVVTPARDAGAEAHHDAVTSAVTAYWNPGRAQPHDARRLRDLTLAVLRQGRRDQHTPVRAADLVDPDTARRLIAAGDGGPAAVTTAPNVPAAVREQARRRPDAVAVLTPDGEIGYPELVGRADELARRLSAAGVGAGDRVAVCLPRGPALIWTTLGVMTAGAAYVPLSADEPPARTDRLLQRSEARTVITTSGLAGRFPGSAVLMVDERADEPAPGPDGSGPEYLPLPEAPGPRSPAYVLFTSGSTGEPKGVMIEHHSVVAFSRHIAQAYRIGAGTRLLAFAAAGFDVSVFEWWAGLSAGATVVLAGDEERRSAQALQTLLERERVEVAELPPSLMPLLDPARLPDLRLVSVGGEAPAGSLVDDWATGRREFWNGYGPTEATVAVTLMRCTPPSGGRVPPIGRPMPGHRAYVLDEDLRLVPDGVGGELCIAGPGLARGYLGRPAETAARFGPDPYGAPGTRLYRTGDRARWTGAGVLEFGGRTDDQITVRGFRIEPAEVEAALSTAPGVAQVAVAARDTSDGLRHLVAYVVPADPAQPPTTATVRAWAADRVATYLVPTRLVLLDRLPMTASGKRDRARLPELPDLPVDPLHGDRAQPAGTGDWSQTERVLARDVIGPLLGHQDAGRTDGFFNLGGNSLQVMQIAARVADRFGVQVSLADFFGEPTIARLAALIDQARPDGEKAPGTATNQPGADGAATPFAMTAGATVPLSYPQQALYGSYRDDGDRPAYHGPIALRVTGDLDFAALRRAFGWLTARHAALRVTVEDTDDGPVQRIHPEAEPPIEVHDVPGDTPSDREQRLRHELGLEGGRDFELGQELPLRVRVYRLGPADHVVQWTFHHIAIDGWSVGVVARELSDAYTAFSAGEIPVNPPPKGDYGDFVSWHRNYVTSPAGRSDLEWWRGYLAGAHSGAVPLRPAGERSAFRLGWINLEIPPETAQAVRELLRRRGMTLYMVCLSVQAILISAQTRSEDVLVVTPYSLRVREEWEKLVGWFVNRVVVRPRVRPAWTFTELVDAVRETCFGVFAHGRVPFELLRAELGLTGADLPAQLSVQNAPVAGVNLGGVEVADVRDDSGREFAPLLEVYSPQRARFQLSVMLRERYDGRMAGGLEYDASCVDDETAARWYAAFLQVLHLGATQPETPVGDLLRLARDPLLDPPAGPLGKEGPG